MNSKNIKTVSLSLAHLNTFQDSNILSVAINTLPLTIIFTYYKWKELGSLFLTNPLRFFSILIPMVTSSG